MKLMRPAGARTGRSPASSHYKGKKEFYQKHFDLYAKRRIREDWQDRKVGLAKNWSTQAGGTGGVSYGIPPQDELGDSMGDDFGL